MARYSAGTRTGAGSTTLPIISLYSGASVNFRIREIGVSNTTAVAISLKLVRLSTTGTQGAGLAESPHDASAATASCAAFTTHSVAPTIAADLGYNASVGAAIGAAYIWTFGGDTGINVNAATTNGIGVIVATGTGQVCDAYITWEE